MTEEKPEVDIDEIYLTGNQALKALHGISRVTLRTWAEEGMPQLKRGKYPLFACLDWAWKNKWESDDASMAEAKKREMTARASLRELELLVKEGKLIPKDEVLAEFTSRILIVKSGLLVLPRMIAALLVGKDERQVMDMLRKAVEELLERFSRKGGVLK